MGVKIYHNPKCSKSRQTLALIKEKGIEPDIVEYLVNPPSAAELKDVLAKLALEPRDIVRRKEAREEGIANDLDGSALIEAICKHPRVLQRPIVVKDGKAAVGRPPENVLNIL
ncbi:MAG: arsenate reductase (glutaredoxin) [Rhodospirillales bacterium]|nr:arsenate reductase (glutaredoxin) [Rhodospirillales bacterium]